MKNILTILLITLSSCNMFKSNPPYAGYFCNAEFPVIEAIHNKDKETLKTMMKQGWNVNSTGKYGMSYLLYAVWEKNYPMTEFLLENGADPNFLSNIWDETPNDGEAYLPLSTVCNGKYNTKFIKLLIDHGANVNDDRAILPICEAASSNDKQKIEYLLEHGADINKFNHNKETVITDQAVVYKWEMVLWLWDKGADPMKAGGTGRNTGGKSNVAYWVQVAIDGTGLTNEGERVKRRLESIGVTFPYQPAQKKDTETDK